MDNPLGQMIREAVKAKCIEDLRAKSIAELRHMWDNLDDGCDFGPYDGWWIMQVLNEKGDGEYCAI